jgi:hypothetical protein
LENLISLLDVKELLSSMTATLASILVVESPEHGDFARLDFFVEKSTGSFCGGDGGLRTIVSSPLLMVLAANGHFVTKSSATAAAGTVAPVSRNPVVVLGWAGAYG